MKQLKNILLHCTTKRVWKSTENNKEQMILQLLHW